MVRGMNGVSGYAFQVVISSDYCVMQEVLHSFASSSALFLLFVIDDRNLASKNRYFPALLLVTLSTEE